MKTLKTLGERRTIELVRKQLSMMKDMPVPFGDDVAAYPLGANRLAVLKTDMLVADTDVPRGMKLRQAARKAIVMNISDFAAKGVKPQAILVSLGLPSSMTEQDILEVAGGLNDGAKEYNALVIGGDTGEACSLVISIGLYGSTRKRGLMLRSDAEPGEIVAVTGLFGKQAAGLHVLKGIGHAPVKIRRALVDSVLLPHARLVEGLALRRGGVVSASVDSSDGLAWSLHELAKASSVGFRLDRLPAASEAEEYAKLNNVDISDLVLYGGEEYELVVTVKPVLWAKAKRVVERVGGELFAIGETTKDKHLVFVADGRSTRIEARGYEHFKSA